MRTTNGYRFTMTMDRKMADRVKVAAKQRTPPITRAQLVREAVARYLAKTK